MAGKTEMIAAGEYLFKEGDPGDCMYIILGGTIEIIKEGAGKLADISTGALLGEMAVIDEKPRSASARAADEVTVSRLDKNDIESSLKELPPWVYGLFRTLSTRVRQMNERVSLESLEEDKIRILRQLIMLSEKFGLKKDAYTFIKIDEIKSKVFSTLGIPMEKIGAFVEDLINKKFLEFTKNNLMLIRNFSALEEYLRYFEVKNVLVKQLSHSKLQEFINPEISELVSYLGEISLKAKNTSWGRMVPYDGLVNHYRSKYAKPFPNVTFQELEKLKLFFLKKNPYNNNTYIYVNMELLQNFKDFQNYGGKFMDG